MYSNSHLHPKIKSIEFTTPSGYNINAFVDDICAFAKIYECETWGIFNGIKVIANYQDGFNPNEMLRKYHLAAKEK